MIAEARYLGAGLLAGLQQSVFGRNVDLDSVNDKLAHALFLIRSAIRPYSAAT